MHTALINPFLSIYLVGIVNFRRWIFRRYCPQGMVDRFVKKSKLRNKPLDISPKRNAVIQPLPARLEVENRQFI